MSDFDMEYLIGREKQLFRMLASETNINRIHNINRDIKTAQEKIKEGKIEMRLDNEKIWFSDKLTQLREELQFYKTLNNEKAKELSISTISFLIDTLIIAYNKIGGEYDER